jgi:hypothetical protein
VKHDQIDPAPVGGAEASQPPQLDAGPVEATVPSGPRNFRAAVQDRWDSNPILVALGLAFSGATLMLTLVVPVVGWVRDNDLSAANSRLEAARLDHGREVESYLDRIDDLQRSLAGIRLGIGSETDYFDVNALVIRREARAEIPRTAASYDEGRFFAVPSDDATWAYEQTTELHSYAKLLGMSAADYRRQLAGLLQAQGLSDEDVERALEAVSELTVHRWRLSADKRISGDDLALDVPTQILVQRVPHERLLDTVFGPAKSAEEDDLRRRLYARDQSGWILQSQMRLAGAGGQLPLIDLLQKQGSVAYAALETPLFDVTVNDVAHGEYLLRQDWLIISTQTDAYLVRRLVADDGRSADRVQLNEWLELFKVCENC